MSGHNKWSKIKHKKGATDAQRSKLFSKHSSLITMEVRKAGGDPTGASVLSAVDRAKKDSMPKEAIERALAKGAGTGGAAIEEVTYEGYGPGGVALIIQAVTDNNNRTAPEIRHVFLRLASSSERQALHSGLLLKQLMATLQILRSSSMMRLVKSSLSL